jgi:hypothetical protein
MRASGWNGLTLDDAEAGGHAAHRHVFGCDRFVIDELRQRFEIAEVALEVVVRGNSRGVGELHRRRIVFLRERVDARPLRQVHARIGLAVLEERLLPGQTDPLGTLSASTGRGAARRPEQVGLA